MQFVGPIAVRNMWTEIDIVEVVILIVEFLEHAVKEVDQRSHQVSTLLGFNDVLSHERGSEPGSGEADPHDPN